VYKATFCSQITQGSSLCHTSSVGIPVYIVNDRQRMCIVMPGPAPMPVGHCVCPACLLQVKGRMIDTEVCYPPAPAASSGG
jgi:hypothetical protein